MQAVGPPARLATQEGIGCFVTLAQLQRIVQALGIAVGIVFTGLLADVSWNVVLAISARLAIVAAAGWIAHGLSEKVVSNSWVRRHVGGAAWVDGLWLNLVRNSDGSMGRVGIVRFVPDGSGVRYEGRNFDPHSGELVGSFTSGATKFEFPDFTFTYEETNGPSDGGNQLGGGRVRFVSAGPSGPPEEFSAWCDGASEQQPHLIEGIRVSDEDLLEQLKRAPGSTAIAHWHRRERGLG